MNDSTVVREFFCLGRLESIPIALASLGPVREAVDGASIAENQGDVVLVTHELFQLSLNVEYGFLSRLPCAVRIVAREAAGKDDASRFW